MYVYKVFLCVCVRAHVCVCVCVRSRACVYHIILNHVGWCHSGVPLQAPPLQRAGDAQEGACQGQSGLGGGNLVHESACGGGVRVNVKAEENAADDGGGAQPAPPLSSARLADKRDKLTKDLVTLRCVCVRVCVSVCVCACVVVCVVWVWVWVWLGLCVYV